MTVSSARRVRIGVVGGGFIAQLVHLPSFAGMADFEIAAIADPHPGVAAGLAARYGGRAYPGVTALLDAESDLDALVVLTPAAAHLSAILDGLEHGLHIFTEKPLCVASADAKRIAEAAADANRVVQVGYMKRYDRAYEHLLAALPRDCDDLRYITSVTYDPDLTRFFRPPELPQVDEPTDQASREVATELLGAQLQRAVSLNDPSDPRARHYVEMYLDTLIHDVNILNGALTQMGAAERPVVEHSALWADGRSLAATLRVTGGVRCSLSLHVLDELHSFGEEHSFYFCDQTHRLSFPAPYQLNAPTRHVHESGSDEGAQIREWRSFAEPFILELRHFHACVTQGARCRTPASQAIADLEILEALYRALD